MLSTSAKLRLIVGAGVLSVLVVGTVALFATRQMGPDSVDVWRVREIQGLLVVMLLLAVVLAWFAYAGLQDDLTRRAAAEAALRSSEAKFSRILEIAADAIISVDERQRILHFNRGAERIFGYASAEMMGQPLELLLPERFRSGHHGHLAEFGATQVSSRQMAERGEIFGRRKDGTEFPAEASISKLEVTPGERVYTVLMRDISERRQRDEEQQRLAGAVATLGMTLEVDATEASVVQLPLPWLGDGAILDVVTGTQQLRRRPSVTGDLARDAALATLERFPLDMDSPSRSIDVLRHGRTEVVETVTDEWIEAHTADDLEYAAMRAIGMRSLMLLPLVAREHVLGVLKIFRTEGSPPFTARDQVIAEELALRAAFALDNARLYATARQATHARDHALGVVSHDLRNPISAIGMSARALLSALPAADTARRELVGNIMASQELTQRMIRDLLDVASIEIGRLSVERREEALLPILERAVGLFEREASEREVVLAIESVEALPMIAGDAERLVQVLSNLISNALRYTDKDGRITVAARRLGDEVEVAVVDTGTGIPPDILPSIFERYWSVRGNAPKGGTGLGLAIARGIVEAHGGRLWADSVIGHGSTFRFTLRVLG
jgi:PAS domain S-box-containing protein